MYAITYIRSSSGDHSVEAQQRRMAQSLPSEYDIVGSYSDHGPGANSELPGLTAAFKRLEAGGVQALCVNSLDRLTRRADQLAAMTQWCRGKGFTIQEVPDISEGQ